MAILIRIQKMKSKALEAENSNELADAFTVTWNSATGGLRGIMGGAPTG